MNCSANCSAEICVVTSSPSPSPEPVLCTLTEGGDDVTTQISAEQLAEQLLVASRNLSKLGDLEKIQLRKQINSVTNAINFRKS